MDIFTNSRYYKGADTSERSGGSQIIDAATTGNSTKLFFEDGTTETIVEYIETTMEETFIDIGTFDDQPTEVDGGVSADDGGFIDIGRFDDGFIDIGTFDDQPTEVMYDTFIGFDNGLTIAEPEICIGYPVAEPEICVDFPLYGPDILIGSELSYVSDCGLPELSYASDCGLPEMLLKTTVVDDAIAAFISDTSVEAPLGGAVASVDSAVDPVADQGGVLTDVIDSMLAVNNGFEAM